MLLKLIRAVLIAAVILTSRFNLDGKFDFYDLLTPLVIILAILVEIKIRKTKKD